MTPQKLAKIRALAEDPRGDPATREIARAALKRYCTAEPPSNPLHPGMRKSAEFERYKFMDLSQWKTSLNGNLTTLTAHQGRPYRVTLFRHKKSPTWGWSRQDIRNDKIDFSGRFATMTEAHEAAWSAMSRIMVFTSP